MRWSLWNVNMFWHGRFLGPNMHWCCCCWFSQVNLFLMFHTTKCHSDSHLNIAEFTLLRWINGRRKRSPCPGAKLNELSAVSRSQFCLKMGHRISPVIKLQGPETWFDLIWLVINQGWWLDFLSLRLRPYINLAFINLVKLLPKSTCNGHFLLEPTQSNSTKAHFAWRSGADHVFLHCR